MIFLNPYRYGVAPFVTAVHRINVGGGADSPYTADSGFTGGTTYDLGSAIDITGLTNPAPATAYRLLRFGNFQYLLTGFSASQAVKLRLHFADFNSSSATRVFDVSVNGSIPGVFDNIDIAALVGNVAFKGLILEYTTTADGSGEIELDFITVADNAMVSAIESYI